MRNVFSLELKTANKTVFSFSFFVKAAALKQQISKFYIKNISPDPQETHTASFFAAEIITGWAKKT